MISMPMISLIDILLRMMVLGQLLLLGGLLLREPATTLRHLLLAAGISVAGLVMLTAPIPDQHYGLLRNLLLLLTDAFAFIFWLLIRYLFDDEFCPGKWSKPTRLALALAAAVYVYALGVQAGNSPLHDVIHALGLMLTVHAGYIAWSGFTDDLLDARRRARIMVVLGISVYSAVLVLFELADEHFRNTAVFGLANAIVLLSIISFAMSRLFRLRHDPAQREQPDTDTGIKPSETGMTIPAMPLSTTTSLSSIDSALAQSLDAFIARQGYHQNGLTISSLAGQLACPEHRLRRLINQTRGYRNFNGLLNDLRIEDAKARLSDPAYDSTPILSLALDLGYDSIGPFNRAFKTKTAQTPGEFRRSIQNRR